MSKRGNALSYELQQKVCMAAIESLRPFASPDDAEAFLTAPLRLRRQMFGQAQARSIGKPSLYAPAPSSDNSIPESWVPFYSRFFPEVLERAGGVDALRGLSLSDMREGFGWSIVLLPGLTHNAVFAVCEQHFKCYSYYDDIDGNVPTNARFPKEAGYGVRVRECVEADEEYASVSANEAERRSIAGITLLERMILELFYWWKTGKHLDISNVTLCTGSRDADGSVPRAGWGVGKFGVSWYFPTYADPDLRLREVSV